VSATSSKVAPDAFLTVAHADSTRRVVDDRQVARRPRHLVGAIHELEALLAGLRRRHAPHEGGFVGGRATDADILDRVAS